VSAEPQTVLLLSHSGDFFVIDRVIDALRELGARPVRFDTDRFPRHVGLSVFDSMDETRDRLDPGIDAASLDGQNIDAVWTRSLWPPNLGEDLDPEHRGACVAQAREALHGFLHTLGGARWINDFHALGRASHKIFQLRAARHAGLATPRTLVTNEPDQVRRFYRRVEGRLVTKLLASLTFGMHRTAGTFHTSDVTEEDLEGLEALRYSPMIFQEKVEKDCELRAMYIAGRVFAGAIRAAGTQGATDWRQAEVTEVGWEPAEVPIEVVARMRRFMTSVGLRQGAFDFIRTPDGEHVFLEVNPVGEWGMLERDLDLPISEAVADALLGRLADDAVPDAAPDVAEGIPTPAPQP